MTMSKIEKVFQTLLNNGEGISVQDIRNELFIRTMPKDTPPPTTTYGAYLACRNLSVEEIEMLISFFELGKCEPGKIQ